MMTENLMKEIKLKERDGNKMKNKKILISIILISFIFYINVENLTKFRIYKNNSEGYFEVKFIDPSTVNCLVGDKGINMDYCYSNFYSKSDKFYSEDMNINWLNVHCYKISNSIWGCGNYITKEYFSDLDYSGGMVEFPLCIETKCYAYIISRGFQ